MNTHTLTTVGLLSTASLIACSIAWSQNTTPPAADSALPKTYISPSTGIQYVLIPPGKYQMGSEKGNPDELPIHEEVIAQPFYMSTCEITQEQWERTIGDKYPNRSFHKEPTSKRLPVEFVSLAKAREFCVVLTAKEGRQCRLPTEVEWEYACRAGSTTEFSSGDSGADLAEVGWSAENSASTTHEVGTKKANAWGLHDMHGNVWEWCETRYFTRYDRRLFGSGTWVARGGSAFNPAKDCRSAKRHALDNLSQRKEVGFRVVMEIK